MPWFEGRWVSQTPGPLESRLKKSGHRFSVTRGVRNNISAAGKTRYRLGGPPVRISEPWGDTATDRQYLLFSALSAMLEKTKPIQTGRYFYFQVFRLGRMGEISARNGDKQEWKFGYQI